MFPHGVTINTRRTLISKNWRGSGFSRRLLTVAGNLLPSPGEILQALEPLTAIVGLAATWSLCLREIKTLVTEGKLLALDRLLGDEK